MGQGTFLLVLSLCLMWVGGTFFGMGLKDKLSQRKKANVQPIESKHGCHETLGGTP